MLQNVVSTRATSDQLVALLSKLPAAVAGDSALLMRIGKAVLDNIKVAFLIKSHGGTDEAGERWQPLSSKTVAYRAGRTKTEKKRFTRPSQALSAIQQSRWWHIYRQSLARYKGDKSRAARTAWFVVKQEGAVTLFQKYGGKHVDMLYKTKTLYNSIEVRAMGSGAVVISSSCLYSKFHHHGITGRLPKRRLWPIPSKWPKRWWREPLNSVKQAALEAAIQAVKGA